MNYQLLPNDWRTWGACYCVNKYWCMNAQKIEEWKLDEFTAPNLNRSQGDAIYNGILPNGIAHGKFIDYENRAYPSIGRFFHGRKHGLELCNNFMRIWDHGKLFLCMSFYVYTDRHIYIELFNKSSIDRFTMFFNISPSGNMILRVVEHEVSESYSGQEVSINYLRNFYISLYDMWIYIKNLLFALYA